MRGLGWLPDRPDGRDFPLADMLGRLSPLSEPPLAASLRDRVAWVLQQGRLGACTGAAVAQAIRLSHVRQYIEAGMTLADAVASSRLASVLWLYYWGRAQEHLTKVDSGSRIRLVLNGSSMLGIPPEDKWPYSDRIEDRGDDLAPFRRMPPKSAFRAARDQRDPIVYHRVIAAGDEFERQVKMAIAHEFSVVGGIDVNWDFVDGRFDPTIPIGPATNDIAGGHAMCIVGYDYRGYIIASSWGDEWGDRGFFVADREFVRSMRDLTVVESAPLYSE